MKKNRLILSILTLTVILAVALLAVACNPDNDDTPDTPPAPPQYTLTFIADGETLTTITNEAGFPVIPPSAPTIDNKNFLGWYLDAQGTGDTVALPNFMPARDYTYYAVYEELPPAPVPNDTFTEKNGDKILEVYGSELVFEFNGAEIRTELALDGDYSDFTVKSANNTETEYCVMLDYSDKTYAVYRYGASPNGYTLYFPLDNSLGHARVLYLKSGNKFEVFDPYFSVTVTEGTYGPAGLSSDEFTFNAEPSDWYFPFEIERAKIKKLLRADEDNTSEILVYNVFMTYDEAMAGEYSYYGASQQSRLSLDGYGYATYTDADGVKHEGLVEEADVEVYSDTFVNFTSTDGKISELFLLMKGQMSNSFAIIGDEIGIYRVFDVAENTAGSYYILLNGFGGLSLYFGGSIEYYPEFLAAEGNYELLESGEFKCTIDNLIDESLLTEAYKEEFTFKLTTYGSDLYATKAFTLFNEDLFKEYADVDGTATLTLDGYGNAKYTQNGVVILEGALQVSDGLVLITAADESQGLFAITEGQGSQKGTFKQIGLERGNYLFYSYANGFDKPQIIFLDGDGNAKLFEHNGEEIVSELASGTYTHTATEGNYTVTFDGKTFTAAFRQMNFGSIYSPDWRYVYIVYDENMAGTLTNAAHTETLVLDGYGLDATYTDVSGKTYTGNYAYEWNVITFFGYEVGDEEYNEYYFTFTVNGDTFAVAGTEAGVYYGFVLQNNLVSINDKLIVDGSGNARYSLYDENNHEYVYIDGTYTLNPNTQEYTLHYTESGSANASEMKFKLVTRNGYPCFVIYNEDWVGTFTDSNGDELVLDGYGNAEYDDDTVTCLLMGSKLDVVTLTVDNTKFTFVLDRTTMEFSTTDKPCGYYHPYADGVISGYTRLFLGIDGSAEIYVYDNENYAFVLSTKGTYEAVEGDIYSFIPENGEAWTFKLSEIGDNRIYSLHIGKEGTYKHTMSVNDKNREFALTLDGYGSAEYVFYDSSDARRTYTGYYVVNADETVTFYAVNYDYGQVYATITFRLDDGSFIILSEV